MFNQQSYGSSKNFLQGVYAWMATGLSLTAAISYIVAHTPALIQYIFANHWVVFGLFIAQIALVLSLSFGVRKMSYPVAAGVFLAYSALTGLTLSSLFLVYTYASIVVTFVVAASMFLAMALYGYFTDADLSSMRNVLLMGLIGLIIAGFVNIFFKSTAFDFIISGIGVIIFSLLTAYDSQKLKVLSYQLQGEEKKKFGIIGALTLYLDFINLFIYLLRFMGQKKDN